MASENNIIEQIEGQNKESGFDATAFISSEAAKEVESIEETPAPEELKLKQKILPNKRKQRQEREMKLQKRIQMDLTGMKLKLSRSLKKLIYLRSKKKTGT